nr:hypothetical protein [Oscillochloris trichoides]
MPLTTLNLMIRRHTDGSRWVDMELRSDQSAAASQLASQCPSSSCIAGASSASSRATRSLG